MVKTYNYNNNKDCCEKVRVARKRDVTRVRKPQEQKKGDAATFHK
jgi:hypothetical protein